MTLPPIRPISTPQFRQLVDVARDVVVVTEAEPLDDPGPRIVYVNEAFTRLTGFRAEEVIGRSPRFLQQPGQTDPATTAEIRRCLDTGEDYQGAVLNFGADGTPYWLDLRIFPLMDAEGRTTHYASIQRDMTARTLAEIELRREAMQDHLTGLLNRRGLQQIVRREWALARSAGGAVAMIDLDNFKTINDTYGHAAGDDVLRVVGEVLAGGLRDSDFAVRLGGDEFALVFPAINAPEAEAVVRRLRTAAADRVAQLGLQPAVTLSVGVAAGTDFDAVTALADEALYRIKESGRDGIEVVNRA